MKSATCLVLLVMSITLAVLAAEQVNPAAAADPVIVGKWDRTDGVDMYTIYANRTTQTIIEGQAYYGTWEYDGSTGYKYIFRWEHSPPGKAPFIDYVTVAADGQSYSGINNYGDDFNCVLVGGADSVPAADSGFPIIYVAIGGGIAAIAAIGGVVYYFVIASRGAGAATAGVSGALAGGAAGVVTGATTLIEPAMVSTVNSVLTNLFSETTANIMEELGYDTTGIVTPNVLSASNTSELASLTNQITQQQQLFNNLSTLVSSSHEASLSGIPEGTSQSVPCEPPTTSQTMEAANEIIQASADGLHTADSQENFQDHITKLQQAAATVLLTPQTTSDTYSIPPESTSG